MASTIRRIAVSTDFTDASDRAVAYAAALARGLGASLFIVHVVKDRARYQEARASLGATAAALTEGVNRVATEVRVGSPAESILEATRQFAADLVVMATHGRTGLAHAFSGSVTEEVIRTACCPVLVLRDSGKVRVHRGAAGRGLAGAA